jgi:hypothetical protein
MPIGAHCCDEPIRRSVSITRFSHFKQYVTFEQGGTGFGTFVGMSRII